MVALMIAKMIRVNKDKVMDNKKTYWTMKNGEKIDVDLMSENHLRNTLKMIIKILERKRQDKAIAFSKKEVDALTKRNHINNYWMWK